jgi:hypothetical protein
MTHVTGTLMWRGVHDVWSEDPGGTWTTGEEAIITVRLVLDRSIHVGQDPAETYWIDDGSTFRAQVAWEFATPYEGGECTVYRRDSYWANVARFDALDPATGHQPSSIHMAQDDGGSRTWLDALMSGGPTAHWYTAHGGMDDWCSTENGLKVLPWDSLASDAARPACPIGQGGAAGSVDPSGTRIDFSCLDEVEGTSADGSRYRELARVDGVLRLRP